MIERNARFYFANLLADVYRCASTVGDDAYLGALTRARATLDHLRDAQRPEAYEEGLLLMRGLEFARRKRALEKFKVQLNELATQYSPLNV